ncbi:MAG: glycosyltransferase N-terminal domain-containing protein [Chitinophagaceae bacterium]
MLYLSAAHLLARSNAKAKKWVDGRKEVFEQLRIWRSKHPNEEVVWMHCASTGEYEQGRPVAEAIKKKIPQCKIGHYFFLAIGI